MGTLTARHPEAERLSRFERRFDLALLFVLIWYLLRWVPRSRRRWIFGALNGRGFQGHAKWLFLEAIRTQPGRRITWVTLDPSVEAHLQGLGLPCVRATTARGVWTMLRAGVAFMTHGPWDFLPPFIAGARWIQLWHGVIWIKHHAEHRRHVLPWWRMLVWWRKGYDVLLAPHPGLAERYADGFRPRPRRVLGAGAPALDALFSDDPTLAEVQADVAREAKAGRFVLWLPTWRPWDESGDFPDLVRASGYAPDEWSRLFDGRPPRLLARPHPYVRAATYDDGALRVLEARPWDDPGPWMRRCAVLVTDYSSVALEGLARDVPAVFLVPDEARAIETGLVDPAYRDRCPGPVVRTWREAAPWIRRFLGGDDPYRGRRSELARALWGEGGPGQSGRTLESIQRALDGG